MVSASFLILTILLQVNILEISGLWTFPPSSIQKLKSHLSWTHLERMAISKELMLKNYFVGLTIHLFSTNLITRKFISNKFLIYSIYIFGGG